MVPTKKIKKGYTDPALIDWQTRMSKRHADEIALRCMADWAWDPAKTRLKILSMPAHGHLFERQFLSHYADKPVEFVGIDRDPDVVKAMVANALESPLVKPHKLSPVDHPVDFLDFANQSVRWECGTFDMIYLDWMGTWSKDKVTQMKAMFSHRLLRAGALFRFTISLKRGDSSLHKSDFDPGKGSFALADIRGGGKRIADWQVYGVPALVVDMARDHGGYKLKPVAVQFYHSYHSKTKTSPEGSFLFRVTKA